MNKLLIATLLAIGAGTALAGEDSAVQDRGYAVYRRVVLGDTSVAVTRDPNIGRTEGARVPGSYARYLMHLGHRRDDAVAQAERAGEAPGPAAAAAAERHESFSSYELYQRTVLGRSEAEILHAREQAPRQLAKARAASN